MANYTTGFPRGAPNELKFDFLSLLSYRPVLAGPRTHTPRCDPMHQKQQANVTQWRCTRLLAAS